MPVSARFLRWNSFLLLSTFALAALPTTASAQGGLLKKAKEKLTPRPEQTGPAPEFTDTLLELNDARIDAWMKGVTAGRQLKAPSGRTVAELNRVAEQAYQKRNELMEGKDAERQEYDAALRKFRDCFNKELRRLQESHEKEMMARMAGGANMAEIQKMTELSMKVSERYAAGDTAGAIKAQEAVLKHFGIDAKADTAKAKGACGKEPAQPKWFADAERELAIGNAAVDEMRGLERSMIQERVTKSGLTEAQFGLAHERILAFLNAEGKPSTSWKFSSSEREALKQRLDEIRKAAIG